MANSSRQRFEYESKSPQRSLFELSDESLPTEALTDGVSVDTHLPWRRDFIQSDVEYSATNRDSIASIFSSRPASTPGNFPDMHWLPPTRSVERPEEDLKRIESRVDVWISRLDRLISDSSATDQSIELSDITPESFSSQDTLTSGSSSSTGEPPDEDDEDEDENGVASSYLSLDEVLRGTLCQSTFDSKNCLAATEKPFQQRTTQQMETQPSPKVIFHKGIVCSDISQACKILNTRYKMEDIAVRKPVMTWSKWNVSQVVRGPHAKSPIWNPTLKRRWDRPNSIVFQELNKEISRRNEELEQIVRKKTEPVHHRSPLPPVLHSSPTVTSSIPPTPSPSLPLPTPLTDPLNPFVPLPRSCPQPESAKPPSEVNRSYFTVHPNISPQVTCRTDPGGYSYATLTIDDSEDADPSLPSAVAATASSRSSSSSSGMGLLRRMVKSVWNIFIGDKGCHRNGSNSSRNSK